MTCRLPSRMLPSDPVPPRSSVCRFPQRLHVYFIKERSSMRKFLFAFLTGAILCWLPNPAAHADVTPHALFGDGMVVQRDMPIVVWGKADPGEKVEVVLSFKG